MNLNGPPTHSSLLPAQEQEASSPLIGRWAGIAFAGLLWALDAGELLSGVMGMDLDVFNILVALPLPSAFVIVMACLHRITPPQRQVWSLLGVTFGSIWAAVSTSAYFLQLTVVPVLSEQGKTDALSLIGFGKLDRSSGAWSLNVLGWGLFLALALIFASPSLAGGKRESFARWAMTLSSISMLLLAVCFVLDSKPFQLVGAGFGWFVGLPLTGLLLASILHRGGTDAGYPKRIPPG